MKQLLFITPEDARLGFGLAGQGQVLAEPETVTEVLERMLADPEVAVVVLDERLLPGLSDERLRVLERNWDGLLLVLPAPLTAPAAGEDYLRRLIRRVLGYQVRLQS